ncbi:MAG: M35 family metallo-endopeptidase [Myxococcota bacterium]
MRNYFPEKLLSLCSGTVLIALLILPAAPAGAAQPAFKDCSGDQQTEISQALANARTLATRSAAYLRGVEKPQRSYDGPYATWFGAYDAWRYTRVIAQFDTLKRALAEETIRFDCTCATHALGDEYVLDPDKPYDVSLCSVFWERPLAGANSRAGAVLEAMSRFTAVLGAAETGGSQSESMALATENPSEAIKAAPNYRHFAEEEKEAGGEHLAGALALIALLLLVARARRKPTARHA